MPRTARVAPKEYVYHIPTRGNNRQDIFKDERDYRKYLEILQRYEGKYRCFKPERGNNLLFLRSGFYNEAIGTIKWILSRKR